MQLYIDNFDRIPAITDAAVKSIFTRPRAHWLCKFPKNLSFRINRFIARCGAFVPTLVLYNIPNRDLGSYSAGGLESESEYLRFVKAIADGVGTHPTIFILEPDAIPHAVSTNNLQILNSRTRLLTQAASILRAHNTNAKVYIDTGHPRWLDSATVKDILTELNGITGVSINVSNFVPVDECLDYGAELGVAHVIDTSRNGNPFYDSDVDGWCNPPNRKLGVNPQTFFTNRMKGFENLDGFLWIKIPGESDGECNGGPRAGQFWFDYAKSLTSAQ